MTIFEQQRRLVCKTAQGLDEASLRRIPDGRKNNILWNLAHILTVQQLLVYKLSGNAMLIPDDYPAMFSRDTSPADWARDVDTKQILEELESTAARFAEDDARGIFDGDYNTFETSTGVTIASAADAIAFNRFHEGVHVGIILSIRKDLKRG